MYEVKKSGAMWQVKDSRGVVQMQSLRRINCTDWVRQNTARPISPKPAPEGATVNT